MFQYRQALVRMRQGDSDRQIAAARIMGRRTAARLRELGTEHHWLDVASPMPADEAIAAALGQSKRASTTVSSLAAQRERIQGWAEQGVSGANMNRLAVFGCSAVVVEDFHGPIDSNLIACSAYYTGARGTFD